MPSPTIQLVSCQQQRTLRPSDPALELAWTLRNQNGHPLQSPCPHHLPSSHLVRKGSRMSTSPPQSNRHRQPVPGRALMRRHQSFTPRPRSSVHHATRTNSATGLDRARSDRRAWSTRTGSWPGPWRRTPSTSTGPTGSPAAACGPPC
jgi:hypothetical protein